MFLIDRYYWRRSSKVVYTISFDKFFIRKTRKVNWLFCDSTEEMAFKWGQTWFIRKARKSLSTSSILRSTAQKCPSKRLLRKLFSSTPPLPYQEEREKAESTSKHAQQINALSLFLPTTLLWESSLSFLSCIRKYQTLQKPQTTKWACLLTCTTVSF